MVEKKASIKRKQPKNVATLSLLLHDSQYVFTLKLGSHLLKKMFDLFQWKHAKNDENSLFHFETCFCSQDIWSFVLIFWSYRENGLIRKIVLISKFTTSQTGKQKITIHILLNISLHEGEATRQLNLVN